MSLFNMPQDDLESMISHSLRDVLNTMLGIQCEGKGCVDHTGQKPEAPDFGAGEASPFYVGSVGFVGKINGMIYLYMRENFAERAVEKITGIEGDELDFEIISDVCGELSNMFAGSFKNTLADMGYFSTLTIPSVLSGDDLFVSTIGVRKHLRFEFQAGGETLIADLALAEESVAVC